MPETETTSPTPQSATSSFRDNNATPHHHARIPLPVLVRTTFPAEKMMITVCRHALSNWRVPRTAIPRPENRGASLQLALLSGSWRRRHGEDSWRCGGWCYANWKDIAPLRGTSVPRHYVDFIVHNRLGLSDADLCGSHTSPEVNNALRNGTE